MKRVMVSTGGGDCSGLNAVIRGIVRRASQEKGWEVLGCMESFNGILRQPMEIIKLSEKNVSGILAQGGTILGTTNKGGPFAWPVQNPDGSWTTIDRSDEMVRTIKEMDIEAVINIGGDGSQKISLALQEKGLNIIGVPKTIDNDLSSTDYTFGFQTAVQTATEALDKLTTTAASHHRVFVLEVMGREAGWIALHTAIAGGADVCLIPEIPYDLHKVIAKIHSCYTNKEKGFCNIVIAEGAKPKNGVVTETEVRENGLSYTHLGGVGAKFVSDLKAAGVTFDIRYSLLGHLQRGGTPTAYDRILASQFGVKAFEMVLEKKYGQMAAYRHPDLISVPLKEVVSRTNFVSPDSGLVETAKGLRIEFGE